MAAKEAKMDGALHIGSATDMLHIISALALQPQRGAPKLLVNVGAFLKACIALASLSPQTWPGPDLAIDH